METRPDDGGGGNRPAWVLLSYFAEPLISLAFTDAYVAATPLFQVFLLLMLRQCFQYSTLLRAVEDNASFATPMGLRSRSISC